MCGHDRMTAPRQQLSDRTVESTRHDIQDAVLHQGQVMHVLDECTARCEQNTNGLVVCPAATATEDAASLASPMADIHAAESASCAVWMRPATMSNAISFFISRVSTRACSAAFSFSSVSLVPAEFFLSFFLVYQGSYILLRFFSLDLS